MIPKGRVVKTVGELRAYLDEVEEGWTEMDKQYLGEFEDQHLWIPYFDNNGKFEGYASPAIDYPAFACNFVMDRPEEENQ